MLTILTGIVGAVLGPPLLTAMRVRDARVRGLAIGVSSHGVGTAQMLHEGRTAGAFSGSGDGVDRARHVGLGAACWSRC